LPGADAGMCMWITVSTSSYFCTAGQTMVESDTAGQTMVALSSIMQTNNDPVKRKKNECENLCDNLTNSLFDFYKSPEINS
jgi:hypothetical protein